MSTWKHIALAVVVLAFFGGGTLYYLDGRASPSASAPTAADPDALAPGFVAASTTAEVPVTGPLAPPRNAPAGTHEYRSTRYRFTLFYPDDLAATSDDEGGGASTFVFQNPQESKGFQIFVVPYTAYQISLARFRQDDPSGVMQSPANTTIDGAAATSFYGSDQTLGPTAEIWFIHGGYLFEVTAPQQDAAWLSVIMATWQFL